MPIVVVMALIALVVLWFLVDKLCKDLYESKLAGEEKSPESGVFIEDMRRVRLQSGIACAILILALPVFSYPYIKFVQGRNVNVEAAFIFLYISASVLALFIALISRLEITTDNISYLSFKTLWRKKTWKIKDIDFIKLDAMAGSLHQSTNYFYIELFKNEDKVIRIPVTQHKTVKAMLKKNWPEKLQVTSDYEDFN